MSGVKNNFQVFKRNGGWTWFQDERAIVVDNTLVFGTAAGTSRHESMAGDIEVTSYDLAKRSGTTFKVQERYQSDDHNAPTLFQVSGGRVLVGYQSHPEDGVSGLDLMRWRLSLNANDFTNWTEERSISAGGPVTYNHTMQMMDENNRIYSFFRGRDSKPHYMISDDEGESFHYAGKAMEWVLDRSSPKYSGHDGGRPYFKYIGNGRDRIHFVCSEDHPRAWDNGIYHGYISGRIIYDSEGRELGPLGDEAGASVHVNKLTRVFAGDADNVAWPLDLHLDMFGFPVVLFQIQKDSGSLRSDTLAGGEDHRYCYARWNGQSWVVSEMCFAGSFLYRGEQDFTGTASLDPNRLDTVFASCNADPVTGTPLISRLDGLRHYEIFKGKTPDGGLTWKWSSVTADSDRDNIRPLVPIWPGTQRAVLWMAGDYKHYRSFDMDIVGFVEQFDPAKFSSAGVRLNNPLGAKIAEFEGCVTFGPPVPGFYSDPEITTENTGWYSHLLYGTARALLAEHKLGNMSRHATLDFLVACRNSLVQGGRLRIAEADSNHPLLEYQRNLTRHNPEQRFSLSSLVETLTSVGFASQPVEYRDEHGELHEFALKESEYGHIFRSSRNDSRASDPELQYSSLIVDAIRVSQLDRGTDGFAEKIHAVGDSHVRFLAGKDEHTGFTNVRHLANFFAGYCSRFVAWHLGPALAFSLGRHGSNIAAQEKIETLMSDRLLPAGAKVMFSFGEIDCRFHVCRQADQQGRPDAEIVDSICEIYLKFLEWVACRGFRPMVWAPFAASWAAEWGDPERPIYGSYERRHEAVARFNMRMREGCVVRGYDFVSLFPSLHDSAGMPRKEYFCDVLHLSQRARSLLYLLMPNG